MKRKFNWTKELENINSICKAAGQAILDVYGESETVSYQAKEDSSPLTMADTRANDLIMKRLSKSYPEIPIISEENKLVSYEERKKYELCWIVDPLDGTKEFIKRNGEFTVNIALIEYNRPILGSIYVPVVDELYYAYSGTGAFLEKNGIKMPLKASDFSIDQEGLRIACSRSHLNDRTIDFLTKFSKPEMVARGSSLKFMMIALAQADLYPRLAPTMEWDVAAADAILTEAGGSIIGYYSGEPLDYNKEDLLNPDFLAIGSLKEFSTLLGD